MHNLEIIDGKAQMAYRSSQGKPWHGLGVPVSDDMTPQQMMKAAGLDWTVSKRKTYIQHFDEDDELVLIPTGTEALVRDTDNKILTEVGKGWNPCQNAEAFKFFNEFVEAGDMVMDTAGSLKDGQIVWALADLKDGFQIFGGDEVKGYLLFSNPHQYGKSIDVKYCMIRVVCNNTITMALNEKGQPGVKVNHRAAFDPERVKEVLGLSHRRLDKFKDAAEFLGSIPYNERILVNYFGTLFGQSEDEDKKLTPTAEKVMGLLDTQPGKEFAKGSLWQMFNAVTYATDHELGRAASTRMESAWFGANAKKKLDALQLALDVAKEVA